MTEHDCQRTDDEKERYEHVAGFIAILIHNAEECILAAFMSLHPTYTLDDIARGMMAYRLDAFISTKAAIEINLPYIDVETFETVLRDMFAEDLRKELSK